MKIEKHLGKGYSPNFFEEVFVIKIVKNTVPWTYVIVSDLNWEEIAEHFTKKKKNAKNKSKII